MKANFLFRLVNQLPPNLPHLRCSIKGKMSGKVTSLGVKSSWKLLVLLVFFWSQAGCGWSNEAIKPSPTSEPLTLPTATHYLLPDLEISQVWVQDNSTEDCTASDRSMQMVVRVENKGQAPAGLFLVRLKSDRQLVRSGLEAGKSIDLVFPGFDPAPQIWIDETSLVVESDESNNQYSTSLTPPTMSPDCIASPTPEITMQEAKIILEGHTAAILDIDVSWDGDLIASGSVDDTLRLWSISQARLVRTMLGHPFPVVQVKFSPNGSTLATGSTDGILRLWQVANGRLIRSLEGHVGWITGLDISRDGKWLASCAEDNTVRIWRLPNGAPVKIIDEGMVGVMSVSFSPDSRAFAWGESDGTIRLRAIDGEWSKTLKNAISHPVISLDFSLDGKYLAAGYSDGAISIWRLQDDEQARFTRRHLDAVMSLSFSPDGRWLASASKDKTILLWQFDQESFIPTPVRIFVGHAGAVNSVEFTPKGMQIVSGSADRTIRLWVPPVQ